MRDATRAVMRRFAGPGLLVLALLAASVLALLSSNIELIGPDLVQNGNLCGPSGNDPCYKPALKGGFPIAFLYDNPGISVEGKLSFFEDRLLAWALVLDIALYFAAIVCAVRLLARLRPVPPDAGARP